MIYHRKLLTGRVKEVVMHMAFRDALIPHSYF